MRMVGLEPTRCHHRKILSLVRLPIPPHPLTTLFTITFFAFAVNPFSKFVCIKHSLLKYSLALFSVSVFHKENFASRGLRSTLISFICISRQLTLAFSLNQRRSLIIFLARTFGILRFLPCMSLFHHR